MKIKLWLATICLAAVGIGLPWLISVIVPRPSGATEEDVVLSAAPPLGDDSWQVTVYAKQGAALRCLPGQGHSATARQWACSTGGGDSQTTITSSVATGYQDAAQTLRRSIRVVTGSFPADDLVVEQAGSILMLENPQNSIYAYAVRGTGSHDKQLLTAVVQGSDQSVVQAVKHTMIHQGGAQ